MAEDSGTLVSDVPSVRSTVPLAGLAQVFSTHVVSVGASGFGISRGVPNLQPVLVQSKPGPPEAVGPSVHGPAVGSGQASVNRLVEPSGVGPSGTAPAPLPMLRPPQVRLLTTTEAMSLADPQVPPAGRRVKSRCETSSE